MDDEWEKFLSAVTMSKWSDDEKMLVLNAANKIGVIQDEEQEEIDEEAFSDMDQSHNPEDVREFTGTSCKFCKANAIYQIPNTDMKICTRCGRQQ